MTTWNRNAGDVGDTLDVYLDGIESLTAATGVRVVVWRPDVEGSAVTLTANVTDAEARRVTVQLGGAEGWLANAEPSAYWAMRTIVSFATGELSFPVGEPDRIVVHARTP